MTLTRSQRGLRGAAVLLLSGLLLGAQQPQRFAASVSTVRVDVIVTDDDGQFIDDLRVEDFQLYEDGARQEILDVQLVDLPSRTVRSLEGAPPATGEVVGDRIRPESTDLGAVVMLLDVPGLFLQNKIRYEDALKNVLGRVSKLDLPHAIYLIDAAGKLRRLQSLTTDADALRRAADTAANVPAVQQLYEDLLYEGALDVGDRSSAFTRLARAEERRRTIYTYRLLRAFVDSLAHRGGRTALVWVSTGVDMADAEVLQQKPYRRLDEQSAMTIESFPSYSPDGEIRGLQQALYDAANTAGVSIYSVDPTALHEFYLMGGGIVERIGRVSDFRGNSLRHAAAETGGEAFIGWTDLERVLESIESHTGRFYLVSYSPPPGSGGGEYHEIRVEVNRPDVEVRARAGYLRYSDAERRSRIVQGALALPGTATGLDVSVQATRAREPGGQAIVIVDTFLRAGEEDRPGMVGFNPGNGARVYGTVRDEGSNLVAQVLNETFAGATGGPGAQTAAAAMAEHRMHRSVHRLDAGEYHIRVAAIDPLSERIGAAGIDVTIRDAGDTWDTSDPWLSIQAPDGSRTAVRDGIVPAGQTVLAYLEVYRGVAPTVGGRVVPVGLPGASTGSGTDLARGVDRTPRADQGSPVIELTAAGDVHSGWVPLRNLPIGSYTIELDIDDLGAGRARTFRIPLRVIDVPREREHRP